MTSDQTAALNKYRNEYARFFGTAPETYYRDDLGNGSLRNIIQPIYEITAEKLQKANSVINQLPHERVLELAEFLTEMNNYLVDISRINFNDISQQAFSISQFLDEKKDKLLNIWAKIAGVYMDSSTQGKSFESLKQENTDYLGQVNALKEQLQLQLKAELGRQEKRFLQFADNNNKNSKWWLSAIILLIILLLILCWYFIKLCWIDTSCVLTGSQVDYQHKWTFIYELIRKSFLRILILSIIIYAIKFAVKNFNALKHNFVINRHKENSLDAALHLMNTLPQGVGRDAVINIASREIFTQHKTGYLIKDQDKIDISLLEQLLSLAKSSDK